MSRQNSIVVTGAREHNLKDVTVELPRDSLVVITGLSGLGQVLAGLRHDLRRGPAPLRRVAERVRAPVPRADGQAGRGLDRGPVAGDLDRPEDDVAQPAVDGRHGHGDLRLPAPAVGADRQAALLQLRPADRRAVGRADHRPDHGHGGGHAVHGHGADRPRPQGRVRQAAGGAARRGLHAREGGRRAAPARGGDRPRQEVQARHLGRRGPAGRCGRDLRKRLADSVETAVALADGIIEIETVPRDGEPEIHTYSRALRLPALRDLDAGARAALVLVQLAARRVPALHRAWARRWRSTRSSWCRTRRCRSTRARSCRGRAGATSYYEQITQAIAERYEVDLDAPWEDLPEEQQNLFLYGTNGDKLYVSYRNRMGRKRSYMTTFEGIVPNLERRYKETDSDWSREKIEEYMSMRPCPECKGARLRPESRAVKVGELPIHEFTATERQARARVAGRAGAVQPGPRDRAADPARDRRAAAVPGQRRRRLPVDGARVGDAVGRRGAADPARDADRLVAGRRALHPRRAVDRPAPARQRAADRDAGAAARPRQHRARGRARRGHDARGRLPGRHGPGRRRARRPRRRARARPRRSCRSRSR